MPRLEFHNLKEMENWIKTLDKVDKYLGYYTDDHELVLIPMMSTAPILYGITRRVNKESAENFQTEVGVLVLPIKRIDWSAEMNMRKE